MTQHAAAEIRSYRDLRVWKFAMDLVVDIYRATEAFPAHERYGLTAQLRRSAVSIPSNIAEGHGRKHLGDYLHQLSVANGSLMEMETQVLISGRLGYQTATDQGRLLHQAADVGRMLAGLIGALQDRRLKQPGSGVRRAR